MSNMGRCGQHGCAFSVRLVNGQRDEYCPECEIDRLRAALATAEAERDEARAARDGWVKWASSSRCIYCGQEFVHDPHDQEGADEPKKAHILTCAKHPMAQAQAALTEARRVLREVEWMFDNGYDADDACPLCHQPHSMGHTPTCALAAVLAREEPHG